jgi:hypothetical protein
VNVSARSGRVRLDQAQAGEIGDWAPLIVERGHDALQAGDLRFRAAAAPISGAARRGGHFVGRDGLGRLK